MRSNNYLRRIKKIHPIKPTQPITQSPNQKKKEGVVGETHMSKIRQSVFTMIDFVNNL